MSVISVEASKDPSSYPTLHSLLQDPFFSEVSLTGNVNGKEI